MCRQLGATASGTATRTGWTLRALSKQNHVLMTLNTCCTAVETVMRPTSMREVVGVSKEENAGGMPVINGYFTRPT